MAHQNHASAEQMDRGQVGGVYVKIIKDVLTAGSGESQNIPAARG